MISSAHIKFKKDKNLSLFEQIYKSAKENDISWFEDSTVYPIDVRQGIYTPASKLAAEKQNAAVLLLIKYGASVHEAAMGAAIGNNKPLAELLRKRYGASANCIVKGAAIAGDREYVEELINVHGASIGMAAEGAAIKGDFEHIDDNTKTLHMSSIAKNAMIGGHKEYALACEGVSKYDLLEGVIISGNIEYAESLVKEYDLNVSYLAKCAAYKGDINYCNKLKEDERWNSDENYRDSVNKGIAAGRFASGAIELIDNFELDDDYNSDSTFSSIFMESCYMYGMNNVILKNNKTDFIHKLYLRLAFELNSESIISAVRHGRLEIPIYIYNEIYVQKDSRYQRFFVKIYYAMVQGNSFFSNDKLALHQLSFIDDHAFLIALQKKPKYKSSFIVDAIPEAIKINETMKRYNLDFDQAQAFLNQMELRKLMLYFPFGSFNTLPLDIYLHIVNLFSPLPFEATHELYGKISVLLNKYFLESDIKKYQFDFWIKHRNRATSFLEASKKITNRTDLSTLIHYQKDLFDGVEKPEANSQKPKHEQPVSNIKDDFYGIVEKYCRR